VSHHDVAVALVGLVVTVGCGRIGFGPVGGSDGGSDGGSGSGSDGGRQCGEASCVPVQAAYISHFSSPGCTGTESYYLPYDSFGYICRTWDGAGQCGTIQRTVTNYSYKLTDTCFDAWPSGNTLSQFVTVYR